MNRWTHGILALLATGVAAAAGILLAHHFNLGPVDDAYISLRYAANWASGDGLCFNPGENVEGYTNFLLVLVEAAAIRLGADPLAAMTVIGWASLAAFAGLFAWFAARNLFPGDVLFPTLAAVLVALNPVLLCWSASGLESTLYALLLWASLTCVCAAGKHQRTVCSAICLVLAALTRPEAAALLPVMLLLVFLEERSARRAVRYALIFLVGYGVYFVGRALHFGYLFPNTFYAKLDYGNAALLARGLAYLWSFAKAVPPLLALGILSLGLIRRSSSWVRGFLLLVAAQLTLVVYEGGDHFAMFRFLVPVVPLLCALALQPCALLWGRLKRRPVAAATVAAAGMAVLGATNLTLARQEFAAGPGNSAISQLDRFRFESRLADQWREMGLFLGHNTPPDASLATFAIGALGFYSGLTVIDMVGIADPVIAHQPRRTQAGAPGHDKFDNQYVLSREPAYVLLVAVLTPGPMPARLQRRVLEAEQLQKVNLDMFDNPAFQENYRLANVRLAGGYMNFFVRRDLPTPTSPAPAG